MVISQTVYASIHSKSHDTHAHMHTQPHTHTHTQPKVVTDVEDEELRKQMEELQLANQEVAGDDDTSDQEVDMNES